MLTHTRRSPGRESRRTDSAASGPSTLTAGSARLPTMTGCTNSTATWRAWAGHCGATHHRVAPGGEPAGQGQRGWRQVLGGSGSAPAIPRWCPRRSRCPRPRPRRRGSPQSPPVPVRGRRRSVARPGASGRRKCRASSSRRARPSSSAFWKTPPLRATTSIPARARWRSAASPITRATAAVEAGGHGARCPHRGEGPQPAPGGRGRGPTRCRSGRSGTRGRGRPGRSASSAAHCRHRAASAS